MADDTILLKYTADTDALKVELNQLEKEMLGVDSATKKTNTDIQAGAKKSANEVDKVNKEVKGLGSSMSTLANNLPFAGQAQQILQMGGALGNVTTATGKSTGAMKLLKIALMGTGIGLLVAGIAGLIAYFKSTDEGAKKLEGAMNAVKIVFTKVVDVFIEFGGAIVTAFSSFDNFKQAIMNLGQAIVDNVINRFTSVMVLFEAVSLAIDGDFSGAMKKGADGLIQLTTGVKNGTDKLAEFGEVVSAAATEGMKLAEMVDALDEKQRKYNLSISENEILLTKLLVAAKNHNLTGQQRIDILKKAAAIEEANFKMALELEEDKLALIKEEIKQTSQKAGLMDEEAQRIVDQEIVINKLKEQSVQLQEKIANRLTQAQEENFKEITDSLQENLKKQLILEEQKLLDGQITKEQYADKEINLAIQTLEEEANLLEIAGKSRVDIDKAILDLKLKQQEEYHKKSIDNEEKYYAIQSENIKNESEIARQKMISTQLDLVNAKKMTQKEAAIQSLEFDKDEINRQLDLAVQAGKDTIKLEEELAKKENEIKKAGYEEDIENKKKAEDEKKQLIVAGLQIVGEIAQELTSRAFDARKQDIQNTLSLQNEKLDKEVAMNQKSLDRKAITQAQFDSRQEKIDKKRKDAERKAKRDAFIADKESKIVQATIAGALAFANSLAQGGVPAGLVTGAIALAATAVQVALIASQPMPKFAKGGIIQGNSHDSGGVSIEAEGGEFIINKSQTAKNKSVLNAINKGTFDQYVHNNYVLPSLKSNIIAGKESLDNRNSELLKSLIVNGLVDTSRLEKLTHKNKNVTISNTSDIASAIASRINNKSYVK